MHGAELDVIVVASRETLGVAEPAPDEVGTIQVLNIILFRHSLYTVDMLLNLKLKRLNHVGTIEVLNTITHNTS